MLQTLRSYLTFEKKSNIASCSGSASSSVSSTDECSTSKSTVSVSHTLSNETSSQSSSVTLQEGSCTTVASSSNIPVCKASTSNTVPVMAKIARILSFRPITRQPPKMRVKRAAAGVDSKWMDRPKAKSNTPIGLEYLQILEGLMVTQLVEPIEVLTGYDEANRYVVANSHGSNIYFALEASDICMRQCCGSRRGFELSVVDNSSRVVLSLTRPYRPCACYCCCACAQHFQHEIIVELPTEQKVIARIKQIPGILDLKLCVYDEQGKEKLFVDGPKQTCGSTAHQPFPIWNDKKTIKIGQIIKKYCGELEDVFRDADTFTVNFPVDLDVRMKAALLATTLLIDYLAFEDAENFNKI